MAVNKRDWGSREKRKPTVTDKSPPRRVAVLDTLVAPARFRSPAQASVGMYKGRSPLVYLGEKEAPYETRAPAPTSKRRPAAASGPARGSRPRRLTASWGRRTGRLLDVGESCELRVCVYPGAAFTGPIPTVRQPCIGIFFLPSILLPHPALVDAPVSPFPLTPT